MEEDEQHPEGTRETPETPDHPEGTRETPDPPKPEHDAQGAPAPADEATTPEPQNEAPDLPLTVEEERARLEAMPVDDLKTKLDALDAQVKTILENSRLAGDNALSATERTALQARMQQIIEERAVVDAVYQAALTKAQAAASDAAAATRALSEDKAGLEAELREARAVAVKADVVLQEFPDLVPYYTVIPADADADAVRTFCRNLQAANARVLDQSRQSQVAAAGQGQLAPSGAPNGQGAVNPPRSGTPGTIDHNRIDAYLRQAMGDPVEFEKRRKAVIQQVQQAAGRG